MASKITALHIVSQGYVTYNALENPSTESVPWKTSYRHSPGVPKDLLAKGLVFFYAFVHCHPETGKHNADEPVNRSAPINFGIAYPAHPPVLVPAAYVK